MTTSYADMVKVDSVTTGTGTLTWGSAVTSPNGQPFLAPTSAIDGAKVVIRIESVNSSQTPTTDWEECESVVNVSAKTFTRGTLRASSTGSRINFSPGTKHVRITVGAEEFGHFVYSTTDPAVQISVSPPHVPSQGGIYYVSPTHAYIGLHATGANESGVIFLTGSSIKWYLYDEGDVADDFVLLDATSGGGEVIRVTKSTNDTLIGRGNRATTDTNGFVYVPTCEGTPTGTPTAHTGFAPIVIDVTNNRLYFYSGGSWRNAGP